MVADDRLTTPSRPGAQLDLRERMAATSWADPGLVFPNTKVKIRRRDTVVRSLRRFLEEAGLPVDVRFHDFRHTAGPGVAYYEDPRTATGSSSTSPSRSTLIPVRTTTSRSWTAVRWTTSCRPSRRWRAG
jgi:integrase